MCVSVFCVLDSGSTGSRGLTWGLPAFALTLTLPVTAYPSVTVEHIYLTDVTSKQSVIEALWEIWAAGASHAGGSSSPGHSAAAFQRGYWGPPIHNMGLCGRPGEDPNAWKQFGPETTGQ